MIVTEGLLSYFEKEPMLGMWRRFAEVLSRFPRGYYISDLHLSSDARGPHVQAFRALMSAFVRGPVQLHFTDVDEATAALRGAGFSDAHVHPADTSLVRIIVAAVEAQQRPDLSGEQRRPPGVPRRS